MKNRIILQSPSAEGDQEPPKIEFPCDYPIKVIGDGGDDFADMVADIVEKFDSSFDRSTITLNPSSKGTFLSVRLTLVATGAEQLEELHQALKATGRVKMVI